MLFNSWEFAALVLGLLALYFLTNRIRYQVGLLIGGSFVFYAYGQPYLLGLLVFSAALNAIISYNVARNSEEKKRLAWAVAGVVVNLLVLAFFKYGGFLADSIGRLMGMGFQPGLWLVNLPLPVGISFYTFQGISLVVDLLRKDSTITAEEAHIREIGGFREHFFRTVFYICFFPQLVAGPIVKARDFYLQITAKSFSKIRWVPAFQSLIVGYFLKMGVADNLSSQTYWIAYPYFINFSSLDLVMLLFGYSFQIFADFAGYSLIAIGIARLFGYELPLNFNFPYLAASFSEFWHRWHISLSSWLREYLYIPLGGSKKGHRRTYINLFLVMFLGGLWHGAAWSYAVWGTWHGMALAVERTLRGVNVRFAQAGWYQLISVLFVFCFVTFSWLLFQLPEFSQVLAYIKAIGSNSSVNSNIVRLLVLCLYSSPVILYHLHGLSREKGWRMPRACKDFGYALMLWWTVFNSGSSEAFIYFQF